MTLFFFNEDSLILSKSFVNLGFVNFTNEESQHKPFLIYYVSNTSPTKQNILMRGCGLYYLFMSLYGLIVKTDIYYELQI